jgi:hypothetical protein
MNSVIVLSKTETRLLPALPPGLQTGWCEPRAFPSREKNGLDQRKVLPERNLRSGKDFILPELVGRDENGDQCVSEPSDDVQAEQVMRLAEVSEARPRDFSNLSFAERQLQRRRYLDYLKRKHFRRDELEGWLRGGPQAESNFQLWFGEREERRSKAIRRKANRLANCCVTGHRLDCARHPEAHSFYQKFRCQCRYCRYCGENIFADLFHKYSGLWPTVKGLLPRPGFRSTVVIAKLDFTAVNLGRMATPQEIREFNDDIRQCIHNVTRLRGIDSTGFGFLWCDEFGGFNSKRCAYNTNLHAHGVYVGPFLPQKLLVVEWAKIRAHKDGACVVWIESQKINDPPRDFYECARHRFIRALGHALKYTGKHVLRSDAARLADLEIAFHGVRRVHTMGLFYHAELKCTAPCSHEVAGVPCGDPCDLPNGHKGEHRCDACGFDNLCPCCNARLVIPKQSGYALASDLRKEGRRDIEQVRREIARERVFAGPGGPDARTRR